MKSPCFENDISKLSKSNVLKAQTEMAFPCVNIEEKALHGTADVPSWGPSLLNETWQRLAMEFWL